MFGKIAWQYVRLWLKTKVPKPPRQRKNQPEPAGHVTILLSHVHARWTQDMRIMERIMVYDIWYG